VIRVDHARVEVSGLWLKAVQMRAEADGISIDKFCKELSKETRQYYRIKQYPTKLGPEKAFRDENGKWRMEDLNGRSQQYTLKNVLQANLYAHLRAYLMGLAMSEMTKDSKGWKPETVILRDEDKVAIVKEGKLELQSWDDWIKKNRKKRAKRGSRQTSESVASPRAAS
jgi:hypothetical protein